MLQESTQELIHGQRQESLFVFMSRVPPPKRDLTIDERNQTVIGDGDAVRIRAEITQHLLGSTERRFAIDHPVWNKELADEAVKESGLNQTLQSTMELELSRCVSLLEGVEEFPTEDLAQNPFREKEAARSGPYPLRVIPR
jgi:hypothetical protein